MDGGTVLFLGGAMVLSVLGYYWMAQEGEARRRLNDEREDRAYQRGRDDAKK